MEFIRRLFVKWHRIAKNRVPKEIKGKLYKQKYCINKKGTREYKKKVMKRQKTFHYWFGADHDNGGELLNTETKNWKEQVYYYRKL